MELKNKLSLDELINLAKKPLKKKEKKKQLERFGSLKRFLISEEIEQGEEHIQAILFYDRYTKWCKLNNEPNKLNLNAFYLELKLHFNKVKHRNTICYLASPKGFDLSPENIHRVNAEFKKTRSKGRINEKKTKEEETE